MAVTLLFMTNGRKAYMEQTFASVVDNLRGGIDRVVFHSDTRDPDYNDWLYTLGHEVVINQGNHGFSAAMRNAWRNVDGNVIHWEDDFILKRPIYVSDLQDILEDETLAQVALKRQSWNIQEKAAGGIVECDPDSYTEEYANGFTITRHRKFFTTNPSMYTQKVMNLGWPTGEHSEGMFGFKVWDAGMHSAFLGGKFDEPIVEHIGYDRTGSEY